MCAYSKGSYLTVCVHKGKCVIFTVSLFYRGSGGRGPSRERTCYPRTKFSPVSVHSCLVVLHFAEKEIGDHFSSFPIHKDAGKHGFREKDYM